jgi:signal transduction histidine kinase
MDKIRILIVDDVAETRKNVRDLLQYETDLEVVAMAGNGRDAVQIASQINLDVILMDINMPDMDGITATEIISGYKHPVQIVILSVQGDPNYMRRAMLAGATDFLVKPPMADDLICAIRRAGQIAKRQRDSKKLPNTSQNIADHPELMLDVSQLETAMFEEVNRLYLYQHNLLHGKLVDRIEALLTGVAHDLRSPLGIVMSILATIPENPRYAAPLDRLIGKAIYCKWLADNFLGISLSEKTTLSCIKILSAATTSLEIIQDSIQKNVKVNIRISQNSEIIFDFHILQFVLMNLVVNSLESTSGKGIIEIFAVADQEVTRIYVADNGPLIPAKDEKNLFELGYTTKSDRPGLGLFVSKRLLNQLKADLSYQKSKMYGKLFCISIPAHLEPEIQTLPQLDAAKKALVGIQAHIAEIREKNLDDREKEALINEFNRLTTSFTEHLIRELLIFETLAVNFRMQIPDEMPHFGRPVQKIEKNVAYCRFLASNILQIAGNVALKIEKISLVDILEEVLILLERKLPANIYTVEYEIDPLSSEVEADAIQLIQVFMNLVKNAIDAMPHGGKLGLELGQEADMVFVKVSDSGQGISQKNLPKLFHLGFSTKPGGYGIGLYSVKNIVDKHHGKIEVQSVPSHGTTFIVSFPFRQPA